MAMLPTLLALALVFVAGWLLGGLTVPFLVYYWDTR